MDALGNPADLQCARHANSMLACRMHVNLPRPGGPSRAQPRWRSPTVVAFVVEFEDGCVRTRGSPRARGAVHRVVRVRVWTGGNRRFDRWYELELELHVDRDRRYHGGGVPAVRATRSDAVAGVLDRLGHDGVRPGGGGVHDRRARGNGSVEITARLHCEANGGGSGSDSGGGGDGFDIELSIDTTPAVVLALALGDVVAASWSRTPATGRRCEPCGCAIRRVVSSRSRSCTRRSRVG